MRGKLGKNVYRISDEEVRQIIGRAVAEGWLFHLHRSAWGNRKKMSDDMKLEKFGTDAKAVRAVQKCIDGERLRDITTPQRAARDKVRQCSYPWIIPGVYFVMDKYLKECMEFVDRCIEESRAAVERYVSFDPALGMSQYERDQAEFKKKHPALFGRVMETGGYPTAEALCKKFRMWYTVYRVVPPGDGAQASAGASVLSPEEVERERAKWREQIKDVAEYSISQMRGAFAEILTHLAEVLADPKRKFKESTVEKPKRFIAQIKDMSFWGDKPFEEFADKVDKLLDGVYAEDLRDDAEYRAIVGKAVKKVVKQFNDLPTVEMERALDF